MAGIYRLATTVHRPPPTNYSNHEEHWYPPDLIPGWRMPIPQGPLGDWRLQLPNHPASPLPRGQLAISLINLEAPPPSTPKASPLTARIATLNPQIPLTSSDSGSETPTLSPHLIPVQLSTETVTPSTQTASTMSGQHSPLSTEKSSDPTAPRPGSYAEIISRLTSIPEVTTDPRWTGTSLSAREILQLGPYYAGNIETEPRKSNATWRLPYIPSPYERETNQTWTKLPTFNNFDNFHNDYRTFGSYKPYGLDQEWSTVPPRQLLATPCPFLDSPPTSWIRQHGHYHGQRTSHLLGRQGPDNEAGGSNNPSTDPPQSSPEEQLQQATELTEWKQQ
ncbi:uncharacterized protein ARMOST_10084 [Armillaria ostoyae]|uniref:Uncharacterized protein n=1 Tax=Armillaria ostoyae TaxID=47428 RepID=A0A284RD96_ARMOS|nr:uncharacterized protein ARMOST_10084 [Armillaria ostoyae]